MLVIDRSSSMSGQKLVDAKNAAKTFIGLLDMTRSQTGLVTFAKSAQLDSPLTHDRTALEAIIDQLKADDGTHIAGGIDAALFLIKR